MTTSNITTIVGAQWGDEGKGKITDFFAGEADYVVRFHGGNNAGHTLVVRGETYKLHLVPSGVLYPHVRSIIGAGVLVDAEVLLNELKGLIERGIIPNLGISERAHVIMPYHQALDAALDGHQGALAAGSTRRGIAPVAADKMYRHGIRIGDLLEPELLREKLAKAYQFNVGIITKVFGMPFEQSLESIFEDCINFGQELKKYITDTEVELYQAHKNNKRILFEGAQGMSLDPDHGMYPHTTSTNNIAGHAAVGSGLGINEKTKIVGVVKAYTSRVGGSPFPTELINETGDSIREIGKEYGTTTGRSRRIGWLDTVQVRQSVRTSGLTDIALTKLDILNGFPELKICVAYDIAGERITEMPASLTKMRIAKPVYETLSGWPQLEQSEMDAMIAAGYDALPEAMKKFINFIETQVGCRVTIISLGPERHQTIVRA